MTTLETLTVIFESDATRFMNATEQIARSLTGIGRIADQSAAQQEQAAQRQVAALQALNGLLRAYGGEVTNATQAVANLNRAQQIGAVSAQQAARYIGLVEVAFGQQAAAAAQATAINARYSGSLRSFQIANIANQFGDFAVQVGAGTNALRAFALQAPQLAAGFGPVGAIIGTVTAVVGGLGAAFLAAGRDADEVGDAVKDLSDILATLGDSADATAQQLVEAFAGASDEMRSLAGLQLTLKTDELRAGEAEALQVFDELTDAVSGWASTAQQFGDVASQAIAGGLIELVEQLQAGDITRETFVLGLRAIQQELVATGQSGGTAGEAVGGFTTASGKALDTLARYERQLEAVAQAQERIGKGVGPIGEKFGPPEPAAERRSSATTSARAARAEPTFDELIRPIERELALLSEIGFEREQITQIMRIENELKRGLTEGEREHLIAVIEAGAAIEAQARVQARADQEHQRALERANALRQRARRELSEDIAGGRLELGQAPETQLRGIFGLGPSREQLAAQERLRLQQRGLGAGEIADLEPMVEEAARLNEQLQLMNEFAPSVAAGLADIGQTAVFEGLDEAGQQFLQTLTNMIFQVVALRLVMASIGLLGAGTGGAVNTTGAGGAGFALPFFGGPRQHGGPVDPRHAFLVGEAGPELFTPRTDGFIVPRGGGGTASRGAGDVNVNAQPIINISSTVPGVSVESQPPRGGVDGAAVIDVLVSSSLARMHSGGKLDVLGRSRGVRRS
jgi:hypothetical protein